MPWEDLGIIWSFEIHHHYESDGRKVFRTTLLCVTFLSYIYRFIIFFCLFVSLVICVCVWSSVLEKKRKAVARCKEQLLRMEVQATDKEENKQIALGTSKLNYLDPRISVAWWGWSPTHTHILLKAYPPPPQSSPPCTAYTSGSYPHTHSGKSRLRKYVL